MIEFRNGIVGNHTDVKDETDVILKECLDSHISIPLGAYVGLLQNKIIVCGGYDYKDILQTCNIIGQPNKLITMHSKRFYAAAVSLNESTIFIIGGAVLGYGLFNKPSESEFITLEQEFPQKGPDLPFGVKKHCMIYHNSTTIYVIGGEQGNSDSSDKTWIIDPNNNFHTKEGPTLNTGRIYHSCGKLIKNGKTFLVVVGGKNNGESLDTVEVLDVSTNQNWIMGKILIIVPKT